MARSSADGGNAEYSDCKYTRSSAASAAAFMTVAAGLCAARTNASPSVIRELIVNSMKAVVRRRSIWAIERSKAMCMFSCPFYELYVL